MKSTLIILLIVIASTVGLIFIIKNSTSTTVGEPLAQATIVDGRQIVEIQAKGGYSPRFTTAKAGVPTTIKVKTAGTFDCSASLTIPIIGYSSHLPASGVTNIEVPAQQAGAMVQGICAMGMYNFAIKFT